MISIENFGTAEASAQDENSPSFAEPEPSDQERNAAHNAVQAPTRGPAAAKMIRDAGLRIIPVGDDKLPHVGGFGAANPLFTVRPDNFASDEYPAILCGPQLVSDDAGFPRHLVCLDLDGALTIKQLEEKLGPLPATLTSHNRKHAFFWVPRCEKRDRLRQWNDLFDVRSSSDPAPGKAAALDLRLAGGYAVERGDWDGPFDVARIAELPERALDALLDSPRARKSPQGDAATVEADRAALLKACRNADDEVIEAAARYIEVDAPPSISGQGGNVALFEVARALVLGFALEPESARTFLDIYNENFTAGQPWPASTIERVIARAEQIGSDKIGGRIGEIPGALDRVMRANGVTAPKGAEAEAANAPDAERPRLKLKTVSAAELSKPLPPVPWLLKGLGIAPGRPTVIVGKAGSGKTLAVQDLAIAVASGQAVFNDARFAVRQGAVLHVDLDQGRYATARRYQQITMGRGIDLASLPLELVFFGFKLTEGTTIDPQAVQALAEASEGKALVIIDSLRGLAPGLDENSSEFGEVLQVLSNVADAIEQRTQRPAPVFLVLHHSGKGESSAAGRGTSAIMDRAGAVWVVAREENSDAATWRHEKASELALGKAADFTTALVKGEPAQDGSPSSFQILTIAASPKSDAVTLEERRKVVTALARHPDTGASGKGLEGAGTGLSRDRLRVVLAVMCDDQQIALRGSGPKANYKLEPAGWALQAPKTTPNRTQ